MKRYSYADAAELLLSWWEKTVPHQISDTQLNSLLDAFVEGHTDSTPVTAEHTLGIANIAYGHGYLRQAGILYTSILEAPEDLAGCRIHAHTLYNMGLVRHHEGRLDEASICTNHALESYGHQSDCEGQVKCLLSQRDVCLTRALQAEANHLLDQALKTATKLDRGALSASLQYHKAVRLYNLGKSRDAQEHFEKLHDAVTKAGDYVRQCQCLAELAAVQNDQGDSSLAMKFSAEAVEIARQNRLRVQLVAALSNIGDYYLDLDQTKNAKRVLREANQLIDETGVELFRAGCLRKRARLAWKLNRLEVCLSLSEESLEVAKSVGDPQEQANAHCGIGLVLKVRKDIERATVHLKESLILHDRYKLLRNREITVNAISKLEKSTMPEAGDTP